MKTLHTIYSTFAKHNMAKSLTVLTMLLIVGIGQVLGATKTYTFTNKSWVDSSNGWTSGKDGNGFTANQGVQVTTGASGANATTKTSFTNVSSVAVQYCTNTSKGKGTIKIQVGSNSAQSFTVTAPSSGGTTLKTKTFTFSPNQTGAVKISVDCTMNSIYIYSVTITTTDATTYTVTYNPNGGSGTMSSSTGSSITISDCSFTAPNGKKISKWNTEDDGSGTSYDPGAVVKEDLTLFAIWEDLPKYTVTLNAGSGSCATSVTESSAGEGVTLPTPTLNGCDEWSFAGWATSAVAIETSTEPTLIAAGAYSPPSDITLYAVYKRTEEGEGGGSTTTTFTFSSIASANNWSNGTAYTPVVISPITITANGGGNNAKYYTSDQTWRMYNGGSLTITTSTGNITNVSSNPSYTFTVTNGTATCTFSETTKFKSITVTSGGGSTTYYYSYPQCTPETATFTVTFDSNGGSAVASQTIEEGKTATKPADPEKEGYTFAGWYNGDTEFVFNTPITDNITLKAKWTINSYTLTWDVNEGNALTGSYTSGSVKFGATITKPADPTRDGHSFKGWHNGTSIVTPATTMPANDLTYTAQWAPVYTITWMVNGQVYNEGNPTTTAIDGVIKNIPTPPANNTLEDCGATEFMGWSESNLGSTGQNDAPNDLFTTIPANPISKNKTFYAVFATAKTDEGEDDVTTTFDFTSGYENATAIGTKTQDGVTITFGKGDNNSNKPTYYDSGNAVRVYAKNTITVACTGLTKITFTFGSDDGSNAITANTGSFSTPTWTGSANSVKFTIGGSSGNRRIQKVAVTYTATTSITTYSDYVTNCCNTPAPTNGAYTSVSGTVVQLKWNGSASRYHITCANPIIDDHTESTSYKVSSLTECETYTFYVSASPKDGCESPKLAIEVTPYIPKTVTFVDGSTTTQKTTSCDSKTVTVPNASKECNTSIWTDKNGNKYSNGQTITPTDNMTLTAQYTIIKYEITFVDEDGTELQKSDVNCGETPTYTGEIPTKEADAVYQYTFAGWSPDIVSANGNATYTATYNKTKQIYTVEWYVNGKIAKTELVEAEDYATAPDIAEVPCGAVIAGWTDAEGGKYEHDSSTLHQGAKPSIQILSNKKFYAVFADIDE